MDARQFLENELLVLRCQEGDREAFETLVRDWQERLWRHAWRLTRNEEAAWDVLQEALVAIAAGVRGLQDVATFPAWAYRIVSNKARDWIRRESRRRRAEEGFFETAHAGAENGLERDARGQAVREWIDRLPDAHRIVLQLRYEQDFDTREIAEILGIPEGTVKSRLYTARKQLETNVQEDSHDRPA